MLKSIKHYRKLVWRTTAIKRERRIGQPQKGSKKRLQEERYKFHRKLIPKRYVAKYIHNNDCVHIHMYMCIYIYIYTDHTQNHVKYTSLYFI